MLGTDDLRAFIQAHSIRAQIVYPQFATPTVPAAAAAMGVEPEAIIKSVLFVVNDEPLLVISNGERRIAQGAIARRLGVGKKQVKIATPEQVLAWTGYPAGGVPPFGHPTRLRTWVDPAVLERETVYGGGGAESTLMCVHTADLLGPHAEAVSVCD
jgi:prolyl-tRNA editing enzyme YbaK/EbsC (Cys-tRNA(Pro) deacylase)